MVNMSLTERQTQELNKAAGWLPPAKRAAFVRSVENHLRDRAFVTGSELRRAINLTLGCYGVSAPQFADHNNKENNHETT